MPAGDVAFWNGERGFGFIKPDGASETVFAHVSQLRGGVIDLAKGERVSFDFGTSSRTGRPEAQNVRPE
jgi:cold shock protein